MSASRYNGRLSVAEVRRLRARGWSSRRIGGALGCTGASVDHVLARLGIGPWRHYRPWTPAEDARLTELWNGGAIHRAIAVALGRTASQVSGRRRRLGLPPRQRAHRPFSADERAALDAEWASGTVAEFAERFDRCRSTISGHALYKLGLPRRWSLGLGRGPGRPPVAT